MSTPNFVLRANLTEQDRVVIEYIEKRIQDRVQDAEEACQAFKNGAATHLVNAMIQGGETAFREAMIQASLLNVYNDMVNGNDREVLYPVEEILQDIREQVRVIEERLIDRRPNQGSTSAWSNVLEEASLDAGKRVRRFWLNTMRMVQSLRREAAEKGGIPA